ncbi:hypothetical protein [Streptomyces sp. NPDC058272]|uniref:hypothetical protein n=1 Tax=Streptomyces sp. NPDC058272 TaxID=3346415 RepID=UPI0036E1A82F
MKRDEDGRERDQDDGQEVARVSGTAAGVLRFSEERDPATLTQFVRLRVLGPEAAYWRGIEAATRWRHETGAVELRVPYTYLAPVEWGAVLQGPDTSAARWFCRVGRLVQGHGPAECGGQAAPPVHVLVRLPGLSHASARPGDLRLASYSGELNSTNSGQRAGGGKESLRQGGRGDSQCRRIRAIV